MSLREAQRQVKAFHDAIGQDSPEYPILWKQTLRSDLIAEESRETIEAIDKGDFAGAIDGLCDLIYVCLGAAITWGIDIEPFWQEVHKSNMAKVGGPTLASGKAGKPDGWVPPNIQGLLHDQIWPSV